MRIDKVWLDEKGLTQFIAMMLVLLLFVFIIMTPVVYHVYMMRQTTLELAHHRALELASEKGYLSDVVISMIRSDLTDAGFPTIVIDGVTYPSFLNSTRTKVLRGGNVHVELKYPAEVADHLLTLIGGRETPAGYYWIQGDDRSEALE